MRDRYTNRKARIEKKFSTSAKELLLKLMPTVYSPSDFSFETEYFYSRQGSFHYDEWVVWDEPDYWTGEQDYRDTFYLLHNMLITQTTDWDGIGKARDAVGWELAAEFDESPFYSPFRIGDATRAQIIRHCRQLVKAGVTWQ